MNLDTVRHTVRRSCFIVSASWHIDATAKQVLRIQEAFSTNERGDIAFDYHSFGIHYKLTAKATRASVMCNFVDQHWNYRRAMPWLMATLSRCGALGLLGYALFLWFSRLAWLRSRVLVLSFTLATLAANGSLGARGYALTHWFSRRLWLRSTQLVLSHPLATLAPHGTLGCTGYAQHEWFSQ